MEQNFYRDDFEQMLKDTSEEFRMYPSRKVWHSIYNDFHPDRKWPSFTVCLVLLTSILYIGISNNNSISKNSRNILVASITTDVNNGKEITNETGLTSNQPNKLPENLNKQSINKNNGTPPNIFIDKVYEDEPVSTFPNSISTEEVDLKEIISNLYQAPEQHDIIVNALADDVNKDIFKKNNENTASSILSNSISQNENGNLNRQAIDVYSEKQPGNNTSNSIYKEEAKVVSIAQAKGFSLAPEAEKNSSIQEETKAIIEPVNSLTAKTKTISTEERVWMEDFAFHNKKNKNKWKSHASIQYYLTPSLGYRELYKNNDFEPVNGGLLLRTSNTDILSQQAAVNLEAGATLLLDLSKKLSFKTGVQINLTNYITNAHKLQHPSQTTVLINDLNNNTLMPVAYNSYHGNVLGSNLNSLNNKTYQVSIPVGLNYKLAGSNKVKWYVGGTVQPTFITGGNVYLISADNKNFVEDPSMLRTWNLNSSLETFASIKTPSGISINVGPQLRYQLLSTYSKQYTYTEKLYNIGIKLGITKKL